MITLLLIHHQLAQHARQLIPILDTLNIEPDGRLMAADLAGLPLPDKAWDDD